MTLEQINYYLERDYGKDGDKPFWRVVWSEDQFEKRLTAFTDSGVELLHPEVRLLPKYKQFIHNKYILERLVPVPAMQLNELTTKVSYEPVYIFQDGNENPLPIKFEVAKFVIETVLDRAAKAVGYAKYKDPEALPTPELLILERERIDALQRDLFGNENDITDALAYKEGISLSGKRLEN
jgi:hypothetical protein